MTLCVDSKDNSVGMSCPPMEFISITYLQTLKELLTEEGVLAINVCARNIELKQTVIQNLFSVFPKLYLSQNDDDDELNVVLFATSCERLDGVKALNDYCDAKIEGLVSDLEEIMVGIKEVERLEESKDVKKKKYKSKKKRGKR